MIKSYLFTQHIIFVSLKQDILTAWMCRYLTIFYTIRFFICKNICPIYARLLPAMEKVRFDDSCVDNDCSLIPARPIKLRWNRESDNFQRRKWIPTSCSRWIYIDSLKVVFLFKYQNETKCIRNAVVVYYPISKKKVLTLDLF